MRSGPVGNRGFRSADRWHSRESVTSRLRLREHDYAAPATYFVTICTEQRRCVFGEVVDGHMVPNVAGLMVESWWYSLEGRYPGILLDAVVVMPNHIHGIVMIGTDAGVSTIPSLSDVMYWFKSITTHDYGIGVREFGWDRYPGRLWQKRYYEHIVRGDRDLGTIRRYIMGNPAA